MSQKQEWILSSFREGFDEFEMGKDDSNNRSNAGFEDIYRWRMYEFTLQRYVKYVPPLQLVRESMSARKRLYELDVYASGGKRVALEILVDVDLAGEEAFAELKDRNAIYDVNEANIVLITEVWEAQNQKAQYYDPTSELWIDEGEAPPEP